jgi:hypothetical protein
MTGERGFDNASKNFFSVSIGQRRRRYERSFIMSG